MLPYLFLMGVGIHVSQSHTVKAVNKKISKAHVSISTDKAKIVFTIKTTMYQLLAHVFSRRTQVKM